MEGQNWLTDINVKLTALKKDVYIVETRLFDIILVFMVKNITNVRSAEGLTTNKLPWAYAHGIRRFKLCSALTARAIYLPAYAHRI